MTKRYLTPTEVAAELSVSPDTVLRMIKRGDLVAVKVSERLYRIPVPAFARYLRGPVKRRDVVNREVEEFPDFGAGEELPAVEVGKPLARV